MSLPQSLLKASSQLRSGELRPMDLVESCLERIDQYEDRIHAWVVVDEEGARRAAEALGQAGARGGWRGPLHGIPVAVKDIVDVAGFPTRAGSPLRENHLAESDAPVVAGLRRAGAIILGKTVTVEFACFDPSPTRNPWEPLRHTPGGSSSGSAAAVALGMCFGAVGTQTGGSLVRPASYCGVATCKPTFGSLSTEGIVPVSYHLDHPGPMARMVGDLEVLLSGMADADLSAAEELPAPPRLGLVESFFMEEADQTVRRVMQAALDRLREAAAPIKPVRLPCDFRKIRSMHRTIMSAEAAAYHRESFAANRQSYGPLITGLLDEGLALSAVDYAAALAQQRTLRRQVGSMFDGVDALVMPSTDTTAPATLETTGTPKFQAPWSCAGVPVVSIPCGVSSDGMPVGMQLVGRHGDEAFLLKVAAWCEACLGFSKVPALTPGDRGHRSPSSS